MKKVLSENKKVALYTIVGIVLMLITVIFTGVVGISKHVQYLNVTIKEYGAIWVPVKNMGNTRFLLMAFIYFDLAVLLLNVVYALLKKKPLRLIPALCLALAVAFLPFLALFIRANLVNKTADTLGLIFLAIFAVINVLAVILFLVALYNPFAQAVSYEQAREDKAPVQPNIAGISEQEVRRIIEEYMAEHIEEFHTTNQEPVEKVKEETRPDPVEEQDEYLDEEEEIEDADDEVEEEEEVEVVDENGQILKIKRKKKVHFETRLRNSEFDLRHKYYDLRDYLKWYGLNNRISIPGDTFSLKRKKYAFITIQGKHIKFYASVDPSKYEDSPIPVERATAKKYIDTPCMLRIRSDLSYRRAKLIVDDMMQEAGFEKPVGPEPKETQHPENN